MDSLLGMDLDSAEQALYALAESLVRGGPRTTVAAAVPFLVAVLDHGDGERPGAASRAFELLSRIAIGDPDAVACGGEASHGSLLEATPEAEKGAHARCEQAVAAGVNTYIRWLRQGDPGARTGAAHLLAFVLRDERSVDDSLATCARDESQPLAVRASALFALGLRGTACADDLPAPRTRELGEATLLEAAAAFAALGSKDPAVARTAERSAVDTLARGFGPSSPRDAGEFPWPDAERLLLAKLARSKGRSARAQTALLRLLPLARDRARAERMARQLLVLAFGEPTAAAFSDWKPSLEVFPGASTWSAEQRSVLRAIASLDVLWPASAETEPRIRHADASSVQVALKRMLELSYYPSRQGLRSAIALAFTAGAGAARR